MKQIYLTKQEIEIVMNALAGTPTLTTATFANKIENILRQYLKNEINVEVLNENIKSK